MFPAIAPSLQHSSHPIRTGLEFRRSCQYMSCMSKVEEIEQAIEALPLSERGQLAKWFNGWEDDDWDRQMATDFGPGGRHEQVPDRVREDAKRGPLLDLP